MTDDEKRKEISMRMTRKWHRGKRTSMNGMRRGDEEDGKRQGEEDGQGNM
jgi:hypothetical protein